jgi:hypothetical protein
LQEKDGKPLVWQCSERYKIKGVVGCINRHVDEETLNQAFVMGWNSLVSEKEKHKIRWKEQQENENLLMKYSATKFLKLIDEVGTVSEMKTDLMLATLECIKVFEDGQLTINFLDGAEVLLQGE